MSTVGSILSLGGSRTSGASVRTQNGMYLKGLLNISQLFPFDLYIFRLERFSNHVRYDPVVLSNGNVSIENLRPFYELSYKKVLL